MPSQMNGLRASMCLPYRVKMNSCRSERMLCICDRKGHPMEVDLDQVTVQDNKAEERYEATVNGHLAQIDYERQGNTIIFIHTEVPDALEGHGIAGKLARTALDDARAQHLAVVPFCPYVASYIRRHPEYKELVPQQYWERLLKE